MRKYLWVFFLLPLNLPADIQTAGNEAGFEFRGEYNRATRHSIDVSAFTTMPLNSWYAVGGGIALGETGGSFDIKAFAQNTIGPLFNWPLYISLSYIYNGLPAWETHSHTLLPLISWKGRWAGIALGPGLRFTNFFGEPPLFEAMLSASVYVNFIDNRKLRIGMGPANFNDFYAGNMGAYALNLNSLVRLTEQWSIINTIELLQSGSVALAQNFYGIAYRGGVQYKW